MTGCGANPITLASGQRGPNAIALDADFVYWTTESSTKTAADGTLRRVAK